MYQDVLKNAQHEPREKLLCAKKNTELELAKKNTERVLKDKKS